MKKAIIITVGNEVTSGHIINSNAAWLAKAIEPLGLTPERVLTLRDEEKTLAAEIRQAMNKYDVIFITGGLGPTHDDVTKPAICKAFNAKLVRDRKALGYVRAHFRKINKPMGPVNESQADAPEGCVVIPNRFGTAPCIHFSRGGHLLFAMPGVPYEMKGIMETEVIPRLKKALPKRTIKRVVIHTSGISESGLYSKIEQAGGAPKGVEMAYLPSLWQVDLRLTATGRTPREASGKLDKAVKTVLKVAGPYAFGRDGVSLEEAIGIKLVAKGLKLASAESCTGGRFAARITSVSGSSLYFLEGLVTYSNNSKIKRLNVKPGTLLKYGAVSAETAAEMAEGACKSTGADIGMSATGVAGPSGGTKEKPVGLVYVGMCAKGRVETRQFLFGEERNRNQDRTVREMLNWLWAVCNSI
ncbi:MAG: CinA family nicotinamide mononucleotide deamidase-related protein [Nitrospinae bacterium]|nr:CinA family nicotinamide mononucleotide deamidase-related protein [Nitrospinota bacterium]